MLGYGGTPSDGDRGPVGDFHIGNCRAISIPPRDGVTHREATTPLPSTPPHRTATVLTCTVRLSFRPSGRAKAPQRCGRTRARTRRVMEMYLELLREPKAEPLAWPTMRARAQGGQMSSERAAWVSFMQTAPLDESAGEGYHRTSNLEMRRAPGSTQGHLKKNARRKGALKHIRGFKRKYGQKGIDCIRHDWRTWKRILHRDGPRRCRPVQRTTEEVLAVVCREDSSSELNWSALVSAERMERSVVTDNVSNLEKMRDEYVQALVQHGGRYVVDVPRPPAEPPAPEDPPAPPAPKTERVHFQLLQVSHGDSRQHTMPTVSSADDVALTVHLALKVQLFLVVRSRRTRTSCRMVF